MNLCGETSTRNFLIVSPHNIIGLAVDSVGSEYNNIIIVVICICL